MNENAINYLSAEFGFWCLGCGKWHDNIERKCTCTQKLKDCSTNAGAYCREPGEHFTDEHFADTLKADKRGQAIIDFRVRHGIRHKPTLYDQGQWELLIFGHSPIFEAANAALVMGEFWRALHRA